MKNYLKGRGYVLPNDEHYSLVKNWHEWYRGKVKSFHSYSQYNGKKHVMRERFSLSLAKKVCEDWANLLINEKMEIRISNEKIQAEINKILSENNFHQRANALTEIAFALGTGAFVEYIENGKVCIDYVRADMIYPLSWENGDITECAFAGEKVIDGRKCIYLTMHLLEDGKYKIENHLFDMTNYVPREVSLPDGIEGEYFTNSAVPMFQIIKPNIVNNTDLDSPMGISVFANSLDVLKGIDLVYDSYENEFRLGKKRIIIPTGMAQFLDDENGIRPVFDDNDTEFYALKETDHFTDIKEINMELRSSEHEQALARNLSLLSAKCGLGSDRYSFEKSGLKTATEVISEKSELYQNLKKNEILIESAVYGVVRAIMSLLDMGDAEVSISFDDSIIEDIDAIAKRAMEEVKLGIIDSAEYFMRVYKLTEAQAEDLARKIEKRNLTAKEE